MLRSLFAGLLFLFLSASSLMACSCGGPETFCQTVSPFLDEADTEIFSAFPIGRRTLVFDTGEQPVIDVVVTRSLRGGGVMPGDTVTLQMHNGLDCNILPESVNDTLEQVFAVYDGFFEAGHPSYIYPFQGLSDCGVTVLTIENDSVFGPIKPGVTDLPLSQFLNSDSYCISGPIPEGCFCTTQVIPFCDQVALYHQVERDFGILRLSIIDTDPEGFDTVGVLVTLGTALVEEVLLGLDFSVGDTVTVIQQDRRGCVEQNFARDVLWTYTDIDYDGVVYTSPRNPFPRLVVDGCDQNSLGIVNDTVATLMGSFPYAAYLEELSDCVPGLSTRNLGDAIGLNVFPNPADDRLTVSWTRARVQQLDLLDVSGRTVVRQAVGPGQVTARIPLDEVPPGVYFLRLNVEGGVATRKVVVR